MNMMDDLSLNTMPIEMLARIQGTQGQSMMNNPLLRIARMRAMMGQGARQTPGAAPEIPPDVAARLSAIQGMNATPQAGPDAGVSIPFPGMTDQGPPPGAHPAQGFLDRFALGLAGTQFPGVNPYSSQGQQFTQALLPALARSWAGQRIAPIQQQADYDQSQAQTRAQMVQANLAAQLKAAEDKNTEAAKAANEPLVPAVDFNTGKQLMDPTTGKPALVRKSIADRFDKLNEFRMTQEKNDLEKYKLLHGQDDEQIGPDDVRAMAKQTPWGSYINIEDPSIPVKQRLEAARLARKQGLKPLTKDDDANITSVQAFQDNMSSALNDVQDVLGHGAMGRLAKFAPNELANLLQTDPNISSFNSTFRLNAIPLLKGLGGKGSGFRMTQAEINQAIRSLPMLTDSYETAQQKVQKINQIISGAAKRYFGSAPKIELPPGAVQVGS